MTLVMTRCPLPLPGAFAVRRRNLLVPFAAPPNPDSGFRVSSFLFDPNREPILKQALKEPIAFMGGIFAGLLRLDLNDEPLKEWINRTAEASGITEDEVSTGEAKAEETPEEIQID